MKFSESWLRTFVNPTISGDDLSHLLTMAGLEVEEEEIVAPMFDSVVVGHVLDVAKHPDADRLNDCRVDVGDGKTLQIVCGAPNVAPGVKVPCALPGANLPNDFKIKLAKVRGIESAGMLCSAKELGIAEDASGLLILAEDAPVGSDLRALLDLDDRLRTLKLTPNRADCLSLTGIAREVAALTGTPAHYPTAISITPEITTQREVILDAPDACPLYCGRVISGVNAKAATPGWMKTRIERSGIRSISALVDITNYVMLELGQPLHAFDNALLEGAIHVRKATPGEPILLLNEQKFELEDDVLVIADDQQPVAMAGIMGGENTGISLETQEMFLESAFFAPKAIAGRARRYGFASDASHRYERGVDFGATRNALNRATRLILDICGGRAGPLCEASAALPPRNAVRLRLARIARVLGVTFTRDQTADLLNRLRLLYSEGSGEFFVTPPSHRFDLEIEEDLIEEIVRLHGYDNIPTAAPQARMSMLPLTENARPLGRIRRQLTDRGFQEVINFAFIDESWESDFSANTSPIRLANPIASQMSVMRSSLIGGMIANVITNLKRKQNRVRVFETGRCFIKDKNGTPVPGFHQPWKLAALAYGSALPEQWGNSSRPVDFFDLKAEVEALFSPKRPRFKKLDHPALHPGRSANIYVDDQIVGFIGELHPEWLQKYDLPSAPILFEVELDQLIKAQLPQFEEVSSQPTATRDLAVVVEQTLEFQSLIDGIKENCPAIVKDVRLFDIYAGKGISPGKKSLAFRIVMQDTQRTLQDAEVETAMTHLIAYLEQAFAAQLRV